MSKSLKNLMTVLASIVLSFGLVIGTYAILNPIYVEKENAAILSEIKQGTGFEDATEFKTFPARTIDGVEVIRIAHVFNEQNPLGYFYIANIQNDFGNMKIRVTVGLDDRITSITFIELNQTMYQRQTENTAESYIGLSLSSDIPDVNAGVTSISINDFMKMMRILGQAHDAIEKLDYEQPTSPYDAIFGDHTIIDTENTTRDSASITIETISDQKGFVYTIEKSGPSYGSNEPSVRMIIATDSEYNVLEVLLPDEHYHHTKGNYYTQVLEYAQSFIETNLLDFPDVYSGVSESAAVPNNTKTLIFNMFNIVRDLIEETADSDDVESSQNFEIDGATIVFDTLKDNAGYRFTIEKSGVYVGSSEASIQLIVATDLDFDILEVELPEDNYHHTGGFYADAVTFVVDYTEGLNLLDVVDEFSGASDGLINTRTLIHQMLVILRNIANATESSDVESSQNFEIDGATIVFDTLKDNVGYRFTIEKSGVYRDGRDDEASIQLIVTTDLDFDILEVELPEDNYHHSGGGRYTDVLDYITTFAEGLSLLDVADEIAGATPGTGNFRSKQLVHEMFVILRDLALENSPYLLSTYQTIDESILTIRTLKDDQGYVFIAEKNGLIHGSNYDWIRLVVTTDNVFNVVETQLPQAYYNHSGGNRYADVLNYTTTFAADLNLLNVADEIAGATPGMGNFNSKILVHEMFVAIRDYVVSATGYIAVEFITEGDDEVLIFTKENNAGYVFVIEKTGFYRDGRDDEPAIQLVVETDEQYNVENVELPLGNYHHSGGARYTDVLDYITTYTQDLNLEDVADEIAGATPGTGNFRSKQLVHAMLVVIREVALG